MTTLFIFRRDLRIEDNIGLKAALEKSSCVLPIFILDPRQLHQPYRSDFCVSFMIDSLRDLDRALKEQGARLTLFSGACEEVLQKLIEEQTIEGVYFNRDYTPFSRERDQKIQALCTKNKILCESYDDALLIPPGGLLTQDHRPYTVYSPFYKSAKKKLSVNKPKSWKKGAFYKKRIQSSVPIEDLEKICKLPKMEVTYRGGRIEGLKLLKNIPLFEHYKEERNFPDLDKTTHLSAHHKFGTVSIRESYWKIRECFGVDHPLIGELYWRDFFTHVLFHFPYVLGKAFQPKYDKLKWSENKAHLQAWKAGKTGFPIVDAGMRELNTTGFMHNRVRMITSSFLIKDLHIDWREGERYFAEKLVDYDPAVNNGSWQWAASTGCDAQPFFRIFNPWLQQKKFDPEAKYIKKWVPELGPYSPKEIHEFSGSLDYPAPIVDHEKEVKKTKEAYSKC